MSLNLPEIEGIHILIETYQTMVLTTNDCERSFSHYNNVHNDSRASLNVTTVDLLLNIHLNGPQLDQFDFKTPIEIWKNRKKRTFI